MAGVGGARKTLRKKKKSEKSNSSLPQSSSSMASSSSSSTSSTRCLTLGIPFTIVVFILVLLGISSNAWVTSPRSSLKMDSRFQIYTADVVHEFHHDPKAFTQGLLYWKNDTLYESIGLYGQSAVRKVALQTGKVEAEHKMDKSSFGEGLTLLDERLYQVTWLRQIGYIYDRNNLSKLASFTHQMKDGWGLATDGKILFGSDGSSALFHIDPQTLKVIRKQTIRYDGSEVHNLNELEYVNGEVWANVWQADCIVRISPVHGTVVGWILLPNLRAGLIASGALGIDVLNGIAWDSDNQRLFVTGKLWPKLFEIKLQPLKDKSNLDLKQMCIPKPVQF